MIIIPGKQFVANIPVPIMELRAKIQEIQDGGGLGTLSTSTVQETLSSALRDTQSILQHVGDVTAYVTRGSTGR